MQLASLCPAPCFAHAAGFEIPHPGCKPADLKFAEDGSRVFYSVLLRNHAPEMLAHINPKVAIIGLSPGGTQIDAFLESYSKTKNYAAASVAGAFAGLAPAIINMCDGLGVTDRLGLKFARRDSLAEHPDIFGTSLIACATLNQHGGSKAFDPRRSVAASRCITERLPREVLNPAWTRLSHVIVLGADAWHALSTLKTSSGMTVLQHIEASGKQPIQFPHPSGENGEQVTLASLKDYEVKPIETYVEEKWAKYQAGATPQKPLKQKEGEYKEKRRSAWRAVKAMRDAISERI